MTAAIVLDMFVNLKAIRYYRSQQSLCMFSKYNFESRKAKQEPATSNVVKVTATSIVW